MCIRSIETVTITTPLGEVVARADTILDPMSQAQASDTRMAITAAHARNEAIYRCGNCGGPVYIARGPAGGDEPPFHFRHFQSAEASNCSWRKAATVRDVGALRFGGQQEGDMHFQLKHALAEALAQDPEFSAIGIEKQIRGEHGARRRPDVSATFADGRQVGFDLQLAIMSVRDILGRNSFYQENHIHHVWLTAASDLDQLGRQGFQDIYFSAGATIYCLSQATLEATRAEGRLLLDELQVLPKLGERGVYCVWHAERVGTERLLRDLSVRQLSGILAFGFSYHEQLTPAGKQAAAELRAAAAQAHDWPVFEKDWSRLAAIARGRDATTARSDNLHLMMAWLIAAEWISDTIEEDQAAAVMRFRKRTEKLLAIRNAANWVSLMDLVLTRHPVLNQHLDDDLHRQLAQLRRRRVMGHYQHFHRTMLAACFPRLAFWLLAKAPAFPPVLAS